LKDTKLIGVVLEALENILIVGDTISKNHKSNTNPFIEMIEEVEGIDKLELLQNHENEDVYKKAVKILESYFAAEENDQIENMAPNINQNQNTFSFTPNMNVPNGGFVF